MNQLTINRPDVVHETIEGEAIIVNLKNGKYYSLLGTGEIIWSMVVKYGSDETILAQAQMSFEGDSEEILSATSSFLKKLVSEELLVSAPSDSNDSITLDDPQNKTKFVKPVLEVYSDMKDLLLLDPIHDVDEQGWPAQKVEQPIEHSLPNQE